MWKRFYDRFVICHEDRRLFFGALACFILAMISAGYDVHRIVHRTPWNDGRIPFLAAIAMAAIGGIILAVLRNGAADDSVKDRNKKSSHDDLSDFSD